MDDKKQAKAKKRLYYYAIHYVARYPCSMRKLKQKLHDYIKKHDLTAYLDQDIIHETVQILADEGYINEDLYAQGVIQSYIRKGKSQRYITQQLYKRLLDDAVIRHAWQAVNDDKEHAYDEQQVILNLARKKRRAIFRIKDADDKKIIQKDKSYFFQQGFSPQAINWLYEQNNI